MAIAACRQSHKQSANDTTGTINNKAAKGLDNSIDTSGVRDGAEKTGKPAPNGEHLIASSDCLSCHKTDTKLIGPSFKAIAEKYKASDADSLAAKVIKGGAGNWGTVPMPSHPDLSADESRAIVKYILSLK